MQRLLAIAAVLAAAGPAAGKEPEGSMLVGLGTSIATTDPGWVLRVEGRIGDRVDANETPINGGRIGFEGWRAGGRGGFAMPIGGYAGARIGDVRTTIGGGVGLWTFEVSRDQTHFGVAPFASTTVEVAAGNMVVALDARLARQVVFETADYNVYSVMVMLGRRLGR